MLAIAKLCSVECLNFDIDFCFDLVDSQDRIVQGESEAGGTCGS